TRGDGGGVAFESGYGMTCHSNEVMTGVRGRQGQYLNAIGIRCAVLNPDGTLGAERTTDPVGGIGTNFEDRCPTGQAVVRFAGRAGAVVDTFSATCAPIVGWLSGTTLGMVMPSHGNSTGG